MAAGRPTKRRNLVDNFKGKRRRLSESDNDGQGEQRVVLGNFNQGDLRFSDESRGNQCTPIACVALAYNEMKSLFVSIQGSAVLNWRSSDLDNILTVGDNLYLVSKRERPDITESYLLFEEVYKNVIINDSLFRFRDDVQTLDESGHFLYIKQVDNTSLENVVNAIAHFANLGTTNSCLFTCRNYTFGVLLSNGKFCLFDSHSRNVHGLPAADGVAVLCIHDTAIDLAQQMLTNCGLTDFEVLYKDPFTMKRLFFEIITSTENKADYLSIKRKLEFSHEREEGLELEKFRHEMSQELESKKQRHKRNKKT